MSINIGEMQRKLSLWAEQDKERRFHDLFDLIGTENVGTPSGGEPCAVTSRMHGSEGGAGKRTGQLVVCTAPAPPPYWGP
jgi:hypothetical protein